MAFPIDLGALGDSLVLIGKEWVKAVNPSPADREFVLNATIGLAAVTARIKAADLTSLSDDEKAALRKEARDYEAVLNFKIGQYAVKAGLEYERAMSSALSAVTGAVLKVGLAALL